MTPEDKFQMFEDQEGECGICYKKLEAVFDRDVHVDHCHTREEAGEIYVRGLLCHNCNAMLGHAKDNIKIMERGIRWLQEHSLET